jgi:hypothetical protein
VKVHAPAGLAFADAPLAWKKKCDADGSGLAEKN